MQTLLLLAASVVFTPPQITPSEGDAAAVRRHDQSIELDVSDQLKRDLRLKDLGITTRVISGTVTLEGDVPTYARRIRAERLIRKVDGVQTVVNRLRVERALLFQPAVNTTATDMKSDTAPIARVSAIPVSTVRVKGLVEVKLDDELVIRDFQNGSVETTIEKTTDVTLDGEVVKSGVLDAGLLVFVEAKKRGDELIAQSIEAFSPK